MESRSADYTGINFPVNQAHTKYSAPIKTGVYRKIFLPCTLRKVFEADQTDSFPPTGVYTEKIVSQIHFFAISGVQGDNFSVYDPFSHGSRA